MASPLSEETRYRILGLLEAGLTVQAISTKTGAHKRTVERIQTSATARSGEVATKPWFWKEGLHQPLPPEEHDSEEDPEEP